MLHSYHTASTASTPATPSVSPSVPTPTKHRRRAKPRHSHEAGADGMSAVSWSLTHWSLVSFTHEIPTLQFRMRKLFRTWAAFSQYWTY